MAQVVKKPNVGEKSPMRRRKVRHLWLRPSGKSMVILVLCPWDLWGLSEISSLSSSYTWPLLARPGLLSAPLHLKDQGKIFTSRINSHFVLQSVVKFSLPIFFSFVSNLLCFKSLDSKGTWLEIELNLAWILVMDFQNTLKFVWLQIKKLGNGPAFLMLTKSCLAVFGSLELSYIQLTRFPSPTILCQREWPAHLFLIDSCFHICFHLLANKSFIQYYWRFEFV